jgi:hypothetical protein
VSPLFRLFSGKCCLPDGSEGSCQAQCPNGRHMSAHAGASGCNNIKVSSITFASVNHYLPYIFLCLLCCYLPCVFLCLLCYAYHECNNIKVGSITFCHRYLPCICYQSLTLHSLATTSRTRISSAARPAATAIQHLRRHQTLTLSLFFCSLSRHLTTLLPPHYRTT